MNAVLLPALVRGCLDTHGLNHRPILLAIDTDVDLSGAVARQWLVITPDHYSVVQELTEREQPSEAFSAGGPSQASAEELLAGGTLLRHVATEQVTTARTHAGLAPGFYN